MRVTTIKRSQYWKINSRQLILIAQSEPRFSCDKRSLKYRQFHLNEFQSFIHGYGKIVEIMYFTSIFIDWF